MTASRTYVEWSGDAIESCIREFMKENFLIEDPENLKGTDSLLEKGIMDSTGVLELVAFIESQFEIKIEDDELIPENLDTFSNIRKFIAAKMNQESTTGRRKSDVG